MSENQLSRPVWWRGRQWAVTTYGIEALDKPYHYALEAERLGFVRDGCFDLALHVAETKTWLDLQDFAAAYAVASVVHAKHFPVKHPLFWFQKLIERGRDKRLDVPKTWNPNE